MAAPDAPVSLPAAFETFEGHWSPRIAAEFNGNHIKVAKALGEFPWHVHDDTDEVFIVIHGELVIEVEGRGPAHLGPGDVYVIPRGARHRPVAEREVHLALIEPADTPNTGDAATAANEVWLP